MKKLISSTLTAAMIMTQLFTLTTYAEDTKILFNATIKDATYTIDNSNKLSIDYKGEIPALTSVNSLYTYADFSTVEFSENVTGIPANALEGCDKIIEIKIPDSVTIIGDKAFAGTKITNMTLGKSVTSVGNGAFLDCTDMTLLTVESSDTAFGAHSAGFNYNKENNEFNVNEEFTLTAPKDSKAAAYAVENKIKYEELINAEIQNETTLEIEYDLDDGTASAEMPKTHTVGKTTELPTPIKEGYAFHYWLIDTNGDGNVDTRAENIPEQINFTGKIKVKAVWAKEYNITYVLNGGKEYDGVKKYSAASENIKLGKAERDGYTFLGWYIDNNNDEIGDVKIETISASASKDYKLYAMWEAAHKIDYELNGGTNYEGAPTQFSKNSETIVLGTPTKQNAIFEGWYISNASGEKTSEKVTSVNTSIEHDIKLFAEWTEAYTITYVLNGGTNNLKNPTSYTSDTETIKLQDPTREGMRFYKWYSDSTYTKVITEIPKGSSGNITLYATWSRTSSGTLGGAKYRVTFDSNGGSEVNSQVISINGKASKPENPTRSGYKFAGWYTDSQLTEEYDFSNKVTKSFVLYAKWTKTGENTDDDTDIKDNTGYKNIIILTIGSKTADLNGKQVENDVAPIIKNDRTMMPIRFITEKVGAEIEWNEKLRSVTITDDKRTIVIHIDSDVAYINGEVKTLDSPAFISNDRTYIPVRFVAEALDCDVDWTEGSRTVTIKK